MMRDLFSGLADNGLGVTLVLLLIAFVAHEPWRWMGLWLGRGVSVDSEIFLWVRLVSTALVAGLVIRVIAFPAGALASIALSSRLLALVCGVVVFLISGRNMAVGVLGGALALAITGFAVGS